MSSEPTSPLAQAFAALIAMLIAAIAEHAAEHPMLAPGCRATIRQLQALAEKLAAMVAAWEAGRPIPSHRRPKARRHTPKPPLHPKSVQRAPHRARTG